MTTIQEVAERAGVSLTTVSHVVNHRDRVSARLRAKVEQAIAELGYQPNPTAQSLRTGRTNLVAMMIPDICNPFYTELVRAVQTELADLGLDTLVYNTDVPGGRAPDRAQEYLHQIQRRRFDGLIVADAALLGRQDELFSIKTPTVFIGKLQNEAVDSIRANNFDAAYAMGRYLLSKGHARIAHVTGPSFLNIAEIRKAGFEKAYEEAGYPISSDLRFEGTFLSPSGHEAVRWLLDTHSKRLPSAIFFANSLMAIGGLAAFADNAISVPNDIAVATYDLNRQLDDVRPRLTTIGVEPAKIAHGALELLNDRVTGRYEGPARTVVIQGELQAHATA